MQTETSRPAQRGRRTGRKKLRCQNRPSKITTPYPEFSTNLAQRVFHDIFAVLEKRPVRLVHFRPDPRGAS